MFETREHDQEWSLGSHGLSAVSGNGGLATQTIDLNSLFSADVYETGSFDLRSIASTTLGSLLNALPIPAFLVDGLLSVVFANDACSKIGSDCHLMHGVRFVDLLPYPVDAAKALALSAKAESLLERAFHTRKPQRAEAILKIHERRIWCRLHIRSVRLASERYLLVLIEDLTSEKKQQRLSQREEIRLRRAYHEMDHELRERVAELQESRKTSQDAGICLEKARERLRAERRRFQELFRFTPMAMALVASDGACRDINPSFTELFGHERDDIPFLGEWFSRTFRVAFEGGEAGPTWLESLKASETDEQGAITLEATCKNGPAKRVRLETKKLEEGLHLVTFREEADIARHG